MEVERLSHMVLKLAHEGKEFFMHLPIGVSFGHAYDAAVSFVDEIKKMMEESAPKKIDELKQEQDKQEEKDGGQDQAAKSGN